MSSCRTAILSRIRQALNKRGTPTDIDEAFANLTRRANSTVQPPLPAANVESFSRAAIDNGAEVHRIETLEELPRWVAARAAELDQTPGVVVSPQFAGTGLQWAPIETLDRVPQATDWGLARGCAGIAETGTVVSVSRDCPSSSLFLVQRLVVVLDRVDIVAYQEEVWERLRQRFSGRVPRTINLITGPSRTADVEQQIQIGAHGPKWTDYVIVD
ncbi:MULTISPECIES: LUD domain-containing protein [unclassified Microbulbifer]|uniref:LutC/YkgG family protein n=1 Tax=unclassified Microbulbifer TaxID=2619833 RepID=UPI0027E3B97F|nr:MULTISPECIES: LUD domain-containing protein [unclassified Microbulbifer]